MPRVEPGPDWNGAKSGISRAVGTAALVAFVVAAAVILGGGASARAMTFTVTGLPAGGAGFTHEIRVTGSFETGDTDRLAAALQGLRELGDGKAGGPRALVTFDSKGGVLEEGMRMGRLLRQQGVASLVRVGNRCLSACALAFLGGTAFGPSGPEPSRRLEIGGQLGYHAFYATRDADARDAATSRARGVTEGRAMSAVIIAYVIEMAADPAIVLRSLVRQPGEMTFVETAGEFVSLGICPVGLPVPRAALLERVAHICSNASEGQLPAWPDLIVEYTPMEARRLLLGQIAHGAGQANVRAGIAARLRQVLRGGKGTEAVYDELASAGLPLPAMREKAYHYELPGTGPVRTSCLVTLSPAYPSDYGVVLITPAGLAPARLSAPAACPELCLYGHDQVINPRVLALADRD